MEGRSTLSELLSCYDDWAKSFSTGKLPHLWKLANITPLFKKGSKTDRNNYRQISLTSIVCKIAEKIVKCRVMGFWRNINILNPFAPEPPVRIHVPFVTSSFLTVKDNFVPNLYRVKRSFKPYPNEHNSVKDTGERSKKTT